MAEPVGPKFMPKVVLTAGRIAHQPFEVPGEMTKAAVVAGGVSHALVGGVSSSASTFLKDASELLEPRGPAKLGVNLLGRLFGKVDASIAPSVSRGQVATDVFWKPFSDGAEQMGQAVANPFAMFYAKRAGYEPADAAEAAKILTEVTHRNGDPTDSRFPWFQFPVPAPKPEPAPEPDPTKPGPPTEPDPAKPAPPTEPDPTKPGEPTEPDPSKPAPPTEPDPTKPGEPAEPDPTKPTPPPGEGTDPAPKPEGETEPAPKPEDGAGPKPEGDGAGAPVSPPASGGEGGIASEELGDPVPPGARSIAPADIAATAMATDPTGPVAAATDASAGAAAASPAAPSSPAPMSPSETPVIAPAERPLA